MSDSTDHNPPRESGPSRNGDADGASEPPPETSDGVPIHRFTLTALEPIFEARQQTEKLKQMTLTVSIANLILNLNLIPFAGLAGAAMATAGSMFIHFWLFCRMLPADFVGVRIFWPGAAAALYLTYVLLAVIDIGMIAALIAIPILFGGLLWLVGFFNPSYPQRSIEPMQQTPA